jgi:thiaminase/transcriptional activator TenA
MQISEFGSSRLALGAGDLWEAATRASFLDAIGDGTLPQEAFDRWLVQDYIFVRGFTSFVALTAAKAPRPEQSLVIGGLSALDEELAWFERQADERGLDLSAEPHPVCWRYMDYLIEAGYAQSFEVLLAIFYGVEVAYTVAWSRLESTGPYADFIDRWTNPAFVEYVKKLREAAESHAHPGQQEEFNRVMGHEREFWRMTWEG